MAYYEEDEVRRLITNLAQWSGDGVAIRSSSSTWGAIAREIRAGWRSSFILPALGIDAAPTASALEKIGERLAKPLWTYYTSSLTFDMQADDIMGIAKSTYHRRLEEAHIAFMAAYREQLEVRKARLHAYAKASGG